MGLDNNLRKWREGTSLSREQLAEKLGISAVSIFRIETGKQQPRPALLAHLAKLFGKSEADFYSSNSTVPQSSMGTRRVPVLYFAKLGKYNVIGPHPNKDRLKSVLTTLDPSPATFAVFLDDRSMEPTFAEGDLVIIDPAVLPEAEDFVMARDQHGDTKFRRYHDAGLTVAGEKAFDLVPLNPAYPIWKSERMQIELLGTMIEHRRFRRHSRV